MCDTPKPSFLDKLPQELNWTMETMSFIGSDPQSDDIGSSLDESEILYCGGKVTKYSLVTLHGRNVC